MYVSTNILFFTTIKLIELIKLILPPHTNRQVLNRISSIPLTTAVRTSVGSQNTLLVLWKCDDKYFSHDLSL